jgi:hypothetical protein
MYNSEMTSERVKVFKNVECSAWPCMVPCMLMYAEKACND